MSKQHSGIYYINEARKHDLIVKPGKGDHFKVYCNGNMMVIPAHRELANGTECAIKKWFKVVAGIILSGVLLACALAYALADCVE